MANAQNQQIQNGKTGETTGLTRIAQEPEIRLRQHKYSNLTDLELAEEAIKCARKELEQVPLLAIEIMKRKMLQARLDCPVEALPSLPPDDMLYFSDLPGPVVVTDENATE